MALGQNWPFFTFVFGNIGQENVFNDIFKQKTPFEAVKTRSSKSRKIEIFSKGLVHGFGKKIGHFSILLF